VEALWAAGVCGRRARGISYKGVGRVSLATRCPAQSSKRRALKANTDGQERHQFTADGARDDAEAAVQSGQYHDGGTRGPVCGPPACVR
jgi:hypothetical protein